jgi:branched-subunit amino acid aminotransferase/4-amino-4-deoxychorismate lyase
LNHSLLPQKEAHISVEDAGFLLGDGVFETCGLFRGVPFLLKAHLDRLNAGLQFVEISQPASLSALSQIIEDLVEANELRDCTARLRITISRGSGGEPTFLVTALPWQRPAALDAAGVALDFLEHPVQAASWRQVKSTSRQLLVLAARQRSSRCFDSLQWNSEGLLTEGTFTNLFIVDGAGTLRTPRLESGCLAGVTRAAVLQVATKLDIVSKEVDLAPSDLFEAAEVFVTSSLSSVVPVNTIVIPDPPPKQWNTAAVGHPEFELSAPGPITGRIQEAYQAWLEDETCHPNGS